MGVFEEAKGKVKQAAGDLTDNDKLQREGEAQVGQGRRRAGGNASPGRGQGT